MFLLKKSNKIFIILIFFIIFFYFINYPIDSAKLGLMIRAVDQELKINYGLWGYVNDYIYKFIDFIFGNENNGFLIVELILAFQIGIIWALNIYQILNELNFLAILIFFNPFVLNFFTLCTRDGIALGLFFFITFKSWNKLKFLTSLFISLSIHKGILPLIFISSLIHKSQNKTKKYFLLFVLISILISLILFIFLRYTDIVNILPDSSYKSVLSYPRIAYTSDQDISDLVRRAYNFYGDYNFKILFFGILGQISVIFLKDYFPKNSFSLSYSVFFISSSLSSIPNADRFIYHAVLIAFPFLIHTTISYFKKVYKYLINS